VSNNCRIAAVLVGVCASLYALPRGFAQCIENADCAPDQICLDGKCVRPDPSPGDAKAEQPAPPPLPPAQAAPAPLAAPGVTPPPVTPPKPPPYARPYRLAFNIGFGFGSASLESLHQGAEDITNSLEGVNPGLDVDGVPKSGLQINAEIAFRYYFPLYLLAQVGFDTLYNKASASYTFGPVKGSVNSDTIIMETPILVGGYYTFFDRLYAFGAVGPSVYFFPRSWWDATGGGIPDFKADPGVGVHVLAGADFLITENLALGLEVRYRYLKTGELKERKTGITYPKPGGGTYDLDFSGVSLGVILRFYVT
jgi:opacity protein-like surface antigen